MASFRKMPVLFMPLAAVLVFLFIGATDATCAAGYKDCDNNYKSNRCEVNILTDVKNCGNCGVKCPTYPYAVSACKAGKCVFTCKAGWKDCNNKWSDGCETDVGKDVHNCGGCGKQCKNVPYASAKCSNYKCMYTCHAGWKNCNNDWTDGCETDVGKDSNNCGGCGSKCNSLIPYASSKCSNCKCEYTCKAGWKDCNKDMKDGCETDVGKDVNNCGSCGSKCNALVPYTSAKCNNYKCEYTCKAGWKDCNKDMKDGCETDVGKDVNNCGSCGTKCNALVPYTSAKCNNYKCEYTCKSGWKDCNKDMKDGCETDVGKDINNCGSCGTKCNLDVPYAYTKCNNYKCEYTCKAGWKNCNNDMKDGCETDVGKDVNNCGSCGTKCNLNVPYASTKCNNHKCEYTCNAGWENCNNDMKDGCETDVGSDVNNCGGCGMKCKDVPYATAACSASKCEYTCEPGWANCNGDWEDGCETDISSDVNNCGDCANVCPEPKIWGGEAKCSDGTCEEKWCIKGWKYSDEKKCCVEDWWPFSSGDGDK
ncbi:hypothetical protein M758_8G066500 [Ceratodon purpureus]|uniref:TNFR-Cys domain-containing protein n=1 Tax=Ceratodon purpureus TaxID=3225 RepID=A0A8T0H498_CERPU|nr:hypothetical protein KC19_8G070600 [Ceratodon purpureus]KAG0607949.1 hypothetical protein M758_8G066500 [Ceratodon purpureus]